MTFYTNWYNIVTMFSAVSFMVMVLLCLFRAIDALEKTRMLHKSIFNFTSDASRCNFLLSITMIYSSRINQSLFAVSITICCGFTFFSIMPFTHVKTLIFFIAIFAPTLTTVIVLLSFVKVHRRLRLFAMSAFFQYDLFSHCLFLYKRYWLEPFARPILVCGSSYYAQMEGYVNG